MNFYFTKYEYIRKTISCYVTNGKLSNEITIQLKGRLICKISKDVNENEE